MALNLLTDKACRQAAPAAKPLRLNDGGSLYLEVAPSGTKSWRWSYSEDGKGQTATLGRYPVMSLALAREQRDKLSLKRMLGESVKPAKAAPQPALAAGPTLREANETYWDARQDTAPGYRANAKRAIELHLVPALGDYPVGLLTRELLMVELNRMNAAGLYVYVRKVRMWVGQMFDWAVEQRFMALNPVDSINPRKAFGRRKVQNFAAVELTEVRELLERMAREKEIQSVLACRMLALTWVRTNELRMMLWSEIDGSLWRIPKGKMKRAHDHLVPLPTQAMAILATLKERSRGSPYVFPNDRRLDRPMSENSVLYLLHRMGYKGLMTGHGWRTVASTWANEHGYDDDAIERQLAHAPEDKVRATYNRAKYLKARRRIMQAWADWLDDPTTEFLDDDDDDLDDADAGRLEG